MIEMIKGFFSGGTFKILAILGIVTCLTGFVVWYSNTLIDYGGNKVRVEMLQAQEKAVEAAVSDARATLGEAITQERTRRERAERLILELQNTPEEVGIRETNEIIENSECERLSDGVIGLLNKYIGPKPSGY